GVQCQGEDDSLGRGVTGLFQDRKGRLWVGVADGLWRWKPGPPIFYPLPRELNGIRAITDDDAGALLIGMRGGIRRFVDGKTEAACRFPEPLRQLATERLLRDRDGGLWAGLYGPLVHVRQGRTDLLQRSDGLSADRVRSIFQDREGSVWVGTTGGLD